MKISVLSYDMSHNCLGRAWVLAAMLQERYEVDIVGPVLGDDIWAPLRNDTTVTYRALDKNESFSSSLRAVDGDVLYAVKPKLGSLGRALAARRQRPRPLIADVDDWEMAFFYDNKKWMARNLVEIANSRNFYATWAMEKAVRRADAVTVSSTWLQQRFGGEIIVHARDERVLNAALVDADGLRQSYGIGDRKLVLFLGSPRRHKGIGVVVAALDQLHDPSVVFMVVGAESSPSSAESRPYMITVGPQPMAEMPRYVAAADVVVLAQGQTRATRAQLPAKVFDAMAMGTPVVASAVSDLPKILDGAGLTFPAGKSDALAKTLGPLLHDDQRLAQMRHDARKVFEDQYSFAAVRPKLEAVVQQVTGEH